MRILVMLLGLLLAGCAQIPSSGPVEEVPMPAEPPGIDIAPQPPQEGADGNRILEGFLLAMADPESDYSVARQYLTADAARTWRPEESTVVYHGAVVETLTGFGVYGERVGELDHRGHFLAGGGAIQHDFGLVETDGEWRVGNPPAGVLVNRYLFERFYSQLTIYFMDRTGSHVVPDLVSVPESLVSPTRIVDALLHGPSQPLAGAVVNAIPVGVRLGLEGATIDDEGVVTVDLRGLNPSMSDEARRRMGAQTLWSLTAIPRVTGLRITQDGNAFDLPGQSADGVLELATQQGYQMLTRAVVQDLFGVSAETPGRFTEGQGFAPLRADLPRAAEVSIPLDGSQLAIVAADRRSVLIGPRDGSLEVVTGYQRIRDTQFVLGRLFALADDEEGNTRVISVGPGGDVSEVTAELPEGMRFHGLSIDQTGVSAAVVVEVGEETRLGRMTLFQGVRLDKWRELPVLSPGGAPVTAITDVQWNSESTLVLAGSADGQQDVFVVRADGSEIEELGGVGANITQVAALPRPGGGLIALRSGSGEVWRYSSPNRWSKADVTVASISYAG